MLYVYTRTSVSTHAEDENGTYTHIKTTIGTMLHNVHAQTSTSANKTYNNNLNSNDNNQQSVYVLGKTAGSQKSGHNTSIAGLDRYGSDTINVIDIEKKRNKVLCVFAGPGAGRRTIVKHIQNDYNILSISIDDLLKAELASGMHACVCSVCARLCVYACTCRLHSCICIYICECQF